MIGKFRPKQLRARLTLWYILVLASVLALSWSLTASFLLFQLRSQLDHYAVQDIETIEGLLRFGPAGRLVLRDDYHNHPESKLILERLVEIRSSDNRVIYRNDRLGSRALGGDPTPGEGEGGYSIRSTRLADGTLCRTASRRYVLDAHSLLIRLAYSEQPIWVRFEELALASLFALPVALALAGVGGHVLAQRSLAPLEAMACRAEQITSDRLHERLPISDPGDELGRLARVFNDLLGRLERSFEQLRRFTSDASHELRTPLTSIRSVGEVALQHEGGPEGYRDAIGSMLEEVNHLTALIDCLLTISRADAGHIQLNPTLFPAMDLAREAAGLLEVLVEEKRQCITIDGDEGVNIRGDRVFLRQALVNIVHNAVKYSPAGSRIHIGVHCAPGGAVQLEVVDCGPGIAPEHADKIFTRFYRVDEGRSRDVGGSGLGLSIAQWAIQVHGGDIKLFSPQGRGCKFQICLPAPATLAPHA